MKEDESCFVFRSCPCPSPGWPRPRGVLFVMATGEWGLPASCNPARPLHSVLPRDGYEKTPFR
jgi:hypothetical protein